MAFSICFSLGLTFATCLKNLGAGVFESFLVQLILINTKFVVDRLVWLVMVDTVKIAKSHQI